MFAFSNAPYPCTRNQRIVQIWPWDSHLITALEVCWGSSWLSAQCRRLLCILNSPSQALHSGLFIAGLSPLQLLAYGWVVLPRVLYLPGCYFESLRNLLAHRSSLSLFWSFPGASLHLYRVWSRCALYSLDSCLAFVCCSRPSVSLRLSTVLCSFMLSI